jgi:indole-3-glycerol phosphate synthase
MAATILERIVRTKRREVEAARKARGIERVRAEAASAPPAQDFYDAVTRPSRHRPTLVAELKRASPSAGAIRPGLDPAALARIYEAAGAAAISVLTDRTFFQGSLEDLAAVKSAARLPVLRKDFVIDEYQVYESRAAGADAILLIAEILTAEQVNAWIDLAADMGMASLVEVHDEAQLDTVIGLIGRQRRAILGINNRDLHRQRTDLVTTERLAARLPAGTPFVAESGIRSRDDVVMMQRAGASAMLIGETLLRADDPAEKLRELLGG